MAPIVFSHGNGFPASTYHVLFDALRECGCTDIRAIEKFGHDPAYPVSDNWPQLVRQLADLARPIVVASGAPVHLLGHSLGGFLSLICAAQHPNLAASVVLLDSPLIGGWRARALGLAKRTPLLACLTPAVASRKRRDIWAQRNEAFEHFRRKPAFAAWHPQVLHDYVEHGTVDGADGARRLAFSRDVETAIYDTLPHNLDTLLRRHPLRCPVAFIGGSRSTEVRRVGLALTRRVTQGRITMIDGTHLFPMEKPIETAAAVDATLRGLRR